MRIHGAWVALALLAGCGGANGETSSTGDDVTEGSALVMANGSDGTVLETSGTSTPGLELRFGVAASSGRAIVTAKRGGRSISMTCESTLSFDAAHASSREVSTECMLEPPSLTAGYDFCVLDLVRDASGNGNVSATFECEYSQPGAPLPKVLADAFTLVTGEKPPTPESGQLTMAHAALTLRETHHAAGPVADTLAFADALAPAVRDVLTRRGTFVSFTTHQPVDGALGRVTVRTDLGSRAIYNIGVFAAQGGGSAHAERLSVVDASGTLAAAPEIVTRIVEGARCVEAPATTPFCLH